MLVGAILATGKRTVTSILEVMGLAEQTNFQDYHRILNRAVWSNLQASKILLTTLVMTFIPNRTIVCGIDDTIERRKGKKIRAKGIYMLGGSSRPSWSIQITGFVVCTNQEYQAQQVLEWFVYRWQVEVTFEEVRRTFRSGNSTPMVRFSRSTHHSCDLGVIFCSYSS